MYYSCSWSFDPITSTPILAVGGNNKIIRIISTTKMTSDKHFIGHGEAINELKFHPKNPTILLSASKDYSIRLWNIQTEVCIAIFGGVEGHKSSVLSADFDAIGSRIASSGKDKSVKVWHLNKPSIEEAIQASFTFDRNKSKHSFRTVMEHFSDHSVDDIHENCVVDCVKWMGNLIFSKVCQFLLCCYSYMDTNVHSSFFSRARTLSFVGNPVCWVTTLLLLIHALRLYVNLCTLEDNILSCDFLWISVRLTWLWVMVMEQHLFGI